jgi:hypothetical protein
MVKRMKRVECITDRLAPGFQGSKLRSISDANPTGGIKACDNAAFGLEPQGYGMANRLAFGPPTAERANPPSKRSQYGGIVAAPVMPPHAIVVPFDMSHMAS